MQAEQCVVKIVKSIDFDSFVKHGREQQDVVLVNGVPWSFWYNECPVTHENDDTYLITQYGYLIRFTRGDILVTFKEGTMAVASKGPVVEESQVWVARLGMAASKFHEPSVINRVSATDQDVIIKRLMEQLGQPNSHSLYQAFKQFANEICHGHESLLAIVQRAVKLGQPEQPDVMAPVDHDLKGNPIHSDLAKNIMARPVPIPGVNDASPLSFHYGVRDTSEPLSGHQQQQAEAGKFR